MDRHTAHLLAAGFRRLLRLADAADADTAPGVSFGMEVVESVPDEPDLAALVAHLAALGIPVVGIDAWAPVHAPNWLAGLEAQAGAPHISHRAEHLPDHIDL